MRSRSLTVWVIVVILVGLLMCPTKSFGTTYFDEGQVCDIDYVISGHVEVYDSLGGTPTVVNLLTGGTVRHGGIKVHDSSRVTIAGGSIEYDLDAFGSSQVAVSQGMIYSLGANNNSQVTISDGVIERNLTAKADSRISLSGGSIGYMLNAKDTSVITVYGSGFNYGLGEILDSTGTLTGLLANGDPINNDFYIATNASIVLVPEPDTLLLIGLGAVILRRKR